jgi:Protein of unknown function (DUF3800)
MSAPVRLLGEKAQPDWVGGLCIALANRWEPERLFMIYTAYFDESGTHAGSALSTIAGFVANARQWRKYEKRTARLFKRYDVNVFHAIDVRRGHGDFKGWTVDRKIEFLDEFQHVINDTLENGAAAFIRDDDYKYYRGLVWPPKARPDSKYTIMVRACLAHTVDVVGHIPQTIEPKLHIVLEDGHKNADDAVRSYKFVQDRLGPRRALSGLTFSNKRDCLPLAAADMFAYTAWGEKVGQKPIGFARNPTKAEKSYRGNMAWIDLNRDSLDSLREQAIRIAYGGPASLPPHVERLLS